MKRKIYVDILKGIGIFYVVFGHVTRISELQYYIWNFHMPLFFLISGFLFDNNKYKNFSAFFKSRFKSIYIPYVLFSLITFLYWVAIERNFRGGEYSIMHQFLGIFYGTSEGNHLFFNGALWFLPCLFTVELMFYFVSKVDNEVGVFALLIFSYVLGSLLLQYNLNVLPLGLHTAFFAILFYGIGFLSKSQESNFINLSLSLKIILLVGCLLIQLLAIQNNYFSSIAETPIYYIPIALTGIIFYLLLSILIKQNSVLEYLGKNSLVILAFQGPIYRPIIKIFSTALNLNIEEVRSNLFYNILISIICLLITIPIIYFYNNYIRKRINFLFTTMSKEQTQPKS